MQSTDGLEFQGLLVTPVDEASLRPRSVKALAVPVLASLAGHRSIVTTQAYIDVNDEMKKSAVELVG